LRIGIYNEPAQGGIGGSEISVAVLAEGLALDNEVEIVHHKEYLTKERLAEISGTDLSTIGMRYVVPEPYSFGRTHNPLRRYGDARKWHRQLSEPYDLFINFTHGYPPFCHAPKGSLIVLFPFNEPGQMTVRNNGLSRQLKLAYHDWEWRKRLESYQHKSAISEFSRAWARRRWGIDCEVIYPPVGTQHRITEKQNIILSVGRFTATGHSKKQQEMISAFGGLKDSCPPDWQYFSVGGVSSAPEDKAYFEDVNRLAKRIAAHVLANLERSRLIQLYEGAKIFWHAAGLGEHEDRPELCEHFGIATVEAMSAGCIPVVIDKGGQSEIVEHGVSGFLWRTLEELKEYTELLMRDEKRRVEMEAAARLRAEYFSRERFISRFRDALLAA